MKNKHWGWYYRVAEAWSSVCRFIY